jgi:integral membrane protein
MALSQLRTFRLTAIAEATSFVLLLVATYVKYGHDQPLGVKVLGPMHGLLFLTYVGLALSLAAQVRWRARTTSLVLLGAVLPFGGYVVDRWLGQRPAA